jgi:hypothetical protein
MSIATDLGWGVPGLILCLAASVDAQDPERRGKKPAPETKRKAPHLIDRKGRVAFKGGRGPFGFKPGEVEQSLI